MKIAIGLGKSVDQLLEEVQQEEERDPPQPPVGSSLQNFNQRNAGELRTIVEQTPLKDMAKHSKLLIASAQQCLLCDQCMRQASRMKAHWRQSHTHIWDSLHRHIDAEAQSLNALMMRPCSYCGSSVRNVQLPAKQCPMLFQILAIRRIASTGMQPFSGEDDKPQAPRKSEASPRYQSFVSPMKAALQKGATKSTTTQMLEKTGINNAQETAQVQHTPHLMTRTVACAQQDQINQGTIRSYFQQQAQTRHSSSPISMMESWVCSLRLKNPHSYCYANAATLALLHALEGQSAPVPELQFLRKVGHKEAERGIELLLPQMLQYRNLVPSWTFDHVQKDAAEFLHVLFEHATSMQVIWDMRKNTADGIRLCTQGMLPILISMPETGIAVDLQDRIYKWHHADEAVTALTFPAQMLCIQLGRYHAGGKLFHKLDLPDMVRVPTFLDDSSVQWQLYTISGAIIHLGRSTQMGHYRALLRVGDSWLLTQDSRKAERMHDGHRRNIYVIFLRKIEGENVTQTHAFESTCD